MWKRKYKKGTQCGRPIKAKKISKSMKKGKITFQSWTTREVKSLWSLLWYFKFITDTDNIFNIFQTIRCSLQFLPQIAHMIAYPFA